MLSYLNETFMFGIIFVTLFFTCFFPLAISFSEFLLVDQFFLACFSVLAQIGKTGRLLSVFLLWPQKVSSSYPLWIEPRQVCILYVYLLFTNTLDPWERHRLVLGTFPQSKNSAYLLVGSPYPWFLCVYGSTLIVEPTSECVVL